MIRLDLGPEDADWKFGDVLRLRTHDRKHEYLYMFVYRKPRAYMKEGCGGLWKEGDPNDRGFAALTLGVPDCPYPVSTKLLPCHFDHSGFGKISASYGGLPYEENWELVDPA